MLTYEKNTVSEFIDELVTKYGSQRSSLLPILQDVQKRYNYVSEIAQQEIASALDIHPVEVYSVISFYSFLHHKKRGRNIVRLCRTIICDLKGSHVVADAVRRELGIEFGETTKDEKISLVFTNCLGMCDQSPAMMVNDRVYTNLDAESACKILSDLK